MTQVEAWSGRTIQSLSQSDAKVFPVPRRRKWNGLMRTLLTIIALMTILAASAGAGTIYEIRTGQLRAGSVVDIEDAVVTAVQANSFCVTELPAGPYTAIWVYMGTTPSVVSGDVVTLKGLVRDAFGRSELSLRWPQDAGVTVTGTGEVPDIQLTTTDIAADPEAWESALITITDGMIVQELLDRGQWRAISVETSLDVFFDDYFYDYATVDVGDCYNNAYGLYTWHDGGWVFKVLSAALTDCTVANEELSFGQVKAIYR